MLAKWGMNIEVTATDSVVAKGSKIQSMFPWLTVGDYFQQMYDFAIDLIKPSWHMLLMFTAWWGSYGILETQRLAH